MTPESAEPTGDPNATGGERSGRKAPGWVRRGRWLVRTEVFPDFQAAMRWVARVARLAERLSHHPDIEIHWNRVILRLTTHQAGRLTDKDWLWAEASVRALAREARPGPQRPIRRERRSGAAA